MKPTTFKCSLGTEGAPRGSMVEGGRKDFKFSGWMFLAGLDPAHQGSQVIEKGVRSIKGGLIIESHSNRGSRIETQFVPKAYG